MIQTIDDRQRPTKRRLFVVGLPRSGTTLIQSVLNAHPDIVSFPESRFYDALTHSNSFQKYGRLPVSQWSVRKVAQFARARARTALGKPGPHAMKVAERFFVAAGLEYAVPKLREASHSVSALNAVFLDVLDQKSPSGWVEKTPVHLFRIPLISKLVPDARFVHIFRRPEDTIASIWDAGQKYEDWPWVLQGDAPLAQLIEFCNRGQSISLRHIGERQHLVVPYDFFVSDQQFWLKKIAAFCDIPFSEDMTVPNINNMNTTTEPWKENNMGKIEKSKSKFEFIFNDEQKNLVLSNLKYRDFVPYF